MRRHPAVQGKERDAQQSAGYTERVRLPLVADARVRDRPQRQDPVLQSRLHRRVGLFARRADRQAAQPDPPSRHATGSLRRHVDDDPRGPSVVGARQEPAQERRSLLGARERHARRRERHARRLSERARKAGPRGSAQRAGAVREDARRRSTWLPAAAGRGRAHGSRRQAAGADASARRDARDDRLHGRARRAARGRRCGVGRAAAAAVLDRVRRDGRDERRCRVSAVAPSGPACRRDVVVRDAHGCRRSDPGPDDRPPRRPRRRAAGAQPAEGQPRGDRVRRALADRRHARRRA